MSINRIFPFVQTYLSGKLTKSVDLAVLQEMLRQERAQIDQIAPAIADHITQYLDRCSSLRKFLPQQILEVGQETKVTLSLPDKQAVSMDIDGETVQKYIKQREVYCRELYTSQDLSFELKEVSNLDLNQFLDRLEGTMEDLCVKETKLLNGLLSVLPCQEIDEITEASVLGLTKGRNGKLFISERLWPLFTLQFQTCFYPVQAHGTILAGQLGYLELGESKVEVHVDSFLPELAKLDATSIVFFADGCGRTLVRRPLTAEPLNRTLVGIHAKGWYIYEIHAPIITNSEKIVVARKVG